MAGECAKEEGHDSGDVVIMFIWRAIAPAFFRGETLPKRTADQMEGYVVPEELRG